MAAGTVQNVWIFGVCLTGAAVFVSVLIFSLLFGFREQSYPSTRIDVGPIRIDVDGNPRCWCGAYIVGADGGRDGNSPRAICERGHITTAFGPE